MGEEKHLEKKIRWYITNTINGHTSFLGNTVIDYMCSYIMFFLFLHKNIYCVHTLEAPHCGASKDCTQYNHVFCGEIS